MSSEIDQVDELLRRARAAQHQFAKGATQERFDTAAAAAAWALIEPARNLELATMAVETTGLGNVRDKVTKNHRKTLGLMRDLQGATTCGVISDDPSSGITEYARPVGVVGAVVPSTNPVATPANNVVNALKGGNAIILSPSPKGVQVCERLLEHIHAELRKIGADPDLVQMVPAPGSKAKTQRLMEIVDLLIVTGSQDNVRRAYGSGTPAIGVGAGNVSVIIDETADLADAAAKITASKTFDNATSCSSENALIVLDSVRADFIAQLNEAGGRLLQGRDAIQLREALFHEGHLNRAMLAKDIGEVLRVAALDLPDAGNVRFLLIDGEGIGAAFPESGEKLSLVTTLYRATDFDDAKAVARRLFDHIGAGHSVGLHSRNDERAKELAQDLPTCRVIVNQAHSFATGGSFDNGMPFSLSMGCGTWGGNSIDENLHWRHFINRTKVVRQIPAREPSLEQVFSAYWQKAGK